MRRGSGSRRSYIVTVRCRHGSSCSSWSKTRSWPCSQSGAWSSQVSAVEVGPRCRVENAPSIAGAVDPEQRSLECGPANAVFADMRSMLAPSRGSVKSTSDTLTGSPAVPIPVDDPADPRLADYVER